MPKLSNYVQQQQQLLRKPPAEAPTRPGASVQTDHSVQPRPAGGQPSGLGVPAHQPLQGLGVPAHQQGAHLQQATGAAHKLGEAYQKRLREHGPRLFRWPDGSLRPAAPAPSPYTGPNRRKWAPLVLHCRTHGGDRGYELTGRSLRYGINVPHQEHLAYLHQAELQPEASAGAQQGATGLPKAEDPLQDPHHPLNSFYKEAAAQVFKGACGRLQ